MLILFFRHGETLLNAEGVFQGVCDSKLSPNGEEHAKAMGKVINEFLEQNTIHSIWRSPLPRVKQTSELALGKKINQFIINESDNLREICFGTWETIKKSELPPEVLEKRENTRYTFKYPGKYSVTGQEGESYEIQYKRVQFFLEKELDFRSIEDLPRKVVLVFAHNGILTNTFRYFTKTPPELLHPVRFQNYEYLIYNKGELTKKGLFN